jgi:phosphatidate phosphatase APP1
MIFGILSAKTMPARCNAAICGNPPDGMTTLSWSMNTAEQRFLRILHRAAASSEHATDQLRSRVSRKLGINRPRQIMAYQGYADRVKVHLLGRVLSNRPLGGPLDEDDWWDNLLNTLRRLDSDEIAGETVTVRYQEQEQQVMTDEEGYYHVEFPVEQHCHGGILWLTASARTGEAGREIQAVHDIMLPPLNAKFGIISDLDDTVIHTGITSLLLAAKLTFLENAITRKPLSGVAALYQVLQRGVDGIPLNPIFYISSSPWNLHDLLTDFIRLNDIPPGPLLLHDLGLDHTRFIKEKGHNHKLEIALSLLDAYPYFPFILIGDSGQEDPAIYSQMTRLRPGRITSIYIRDVDPDTDAPCDDAARLGMEIAAEEGVPMILARDSRDISLHARRIGLIGDAAIEEVEAEVEADMDRPETGEQSIKDALAAVL